MSKFSNSLNFIILKNGLRQLGLDPEWCQNKAEAVNTLYLYFKNNHMSLEYVCPKCGGDLPELEFCPFCGENFSGINDKKTQDKYLSVLPIEPIDIKKYGEITVYHVNKVHISLAKTFGVDAWNYIVDKLMVPDVLIHRYINKEKYAIYDPFSEGLSFRFSKVLVVAEAFKQSLILYLTWPKNMYGNYTTKVRDLKRPIRRLSSRMIIKNKNDLDIGIQLIQHSLFLSKQHNQE